MIRVCISGMSTDIVCSRVQFFFKKKKTKKKKTLKIHTFFPLFSVRFAFVHSFRNFSCSFFSSFISCSQLSTLLMLLPFYLKLASIASIAIAFGFDSIRFDSRLFSFFSCCIHRRYSLLHKSGSLLFFLL